MHRRRVRNIAIAVTVVIACYALQAFLVPLLVRSQGVERAAAAGVTLELPRVVYNPFRCRLELYDVAARLSDGPALASVGAARINLSFWGSLFRLGVALDDVLLQEPAITLHRDAEGGIQWARIGAGAGEPAVDEAGSGEGIRVYVRRAEVVDGRIAYDEPSHPREYRTALADLDFVLRELDTAIGEPGPFSIDFETETQGTVVLEGTVRPRPWELRGALRVDSMVLTPGWRYVDHQQPVSIVRGTLDATVPWRVGLGASGLEAQVDDARGALTDFALGWSDTGDEFLALERVELGPVVFSLGDRLLDLGGLQLTGLGVDLDREDETRLAGLAGGDGEAGRTDADGAADGAPALPLTVRLPLLSVVDSRLAWSDGTFPGGLALELAVESATVRDFDSAAPAPLPLSLQGTVNGDGALSIDGQLAWAEGTLASELSLARFPLADLDPVVRSLSRASVNDGRLELTAAVDTAAGDFSASAAVTELVVTEADAGPGEPVLGLDRVALDGATGKLDGTGLRVERVALAGLDARLARFADGSNTLTRLLPPVPPAGDGGDDETDPAAEPLAETTDAPVPLVIARIELEDLAIDVRDGAVTPEFRTALTDFGGTVTGVGTDLVEIDLAGSIDGQAPVRVTGSQRAGEASGLRLAVTTDNVELTPFSPYAGKYLGYRVRRGKLETELEYSVEDRRLTGRNDILLADFELGETVESDDALAVPLKLGLALLRGLDGQIRIDLPVSGDLDDPSFSVGGIVVRAFVNLIVKIAASPFSILGALVPGGGDDLQYVSFPAGSAALAAGEAEALGKLAEALRQRPSLTLEVPGIAAREPDARALARERLAAELGTSDDDAYRQAVSDRYLVRFPPAEVAAGEAAEDGGTEPVAEPALPAFATMEDALLADFTVSDEDLRELARERARAIVAVLGAAPELAERVFTLEPRVRANPDEASSPGTVAMELAVGTR